MVNFEANTPPNYAAAATKYGYLCKSNQFLLENADAPDTCGTGDKECKFIGSDKKCISCFPGWFLRATDKKCV
jgi:hypothetical protein